MVRPQWQFLLAGGTTDQYLAKISSADGDYEWRSPSGGGSPGGSDTQIQFNNAGVFAGSENLVYDGTKIASNVKIEASNASGTFFDTGAGTFDVGDTAAIANLTTINLDDANNRIVLSANRPVIGNAANSGKVYMWNGSTSTYWYLAIGTAGAIITGDTGSASIP